MTREELLATVHVLQPGDLLFIRVDRDDLDPETASKIEQLVRAKLPTGVHVLVGDRQVSIEHYRADPEVAATP